jgi:hypothetical protein
MLYENAGQPQAAYDQFAALAELDPHSIDVQAQLLQTATVLAKKEQARAHLTRIYKLYEQGCAQEEWFRREQFKVGNHPVLVTEYFELRGPTAVKYRFVVYDEQGREIQYRVTLGSYDFTTQSARALGTVNKDERMYHLDYYRGPEHRTYGFFPAKPPTYEEARAMFVEIAEGKRKVISSSVADKDDQKRDGK